MQKFCDRPTYSYILCFCFIIHVHIVFVLIHVHQLCKFLSFHSGAVALAVLLACCTTQLDDLCPALWDTMVVPSSRVQCPVKNSTRGGWSRDIYLIHTHPHQHLPECWITSPSFQQTCCARHLGTWVQSLV